jgi:hypothetical protein
VSGVKKDPDRERFEWHRDEVEPVIRAVEKVTGTPWFSIGVDLGHGPRYICDQRALTYDDRTGGALCVVAFLCGVVKGAGLAGDLIPGPMREQVRNAGVNPSTPMYQREWKAAERVASHVASAYRDGVADGKAIKADG